ncbi:MAG: DUF3817 domain-containing protein [Planctomycetota bacterium]
MQRPLHYLRILSFVDGVTLLLTMGIGSTLKRLADIHEPVFIFGSIHGGVFIALAIFTFYLLARGVISVKTTGLVALTAMIPFAPFFLDRYLKRLEQEHAAESVQAPS